MQLGQRAALAAIVAALGAAPASADAPRDLLRALIELRSLTKAPATRDQYSDRVAKLSAEHDLAVMAGDIRPQSAAAIDAAVRWGRVVVTVWDYRRRGGPCDPVRWESTHQRCRDSVSAELRSNGLAPDWVDDIGANSEADSPAALALGRLSDAIGTAMMALAP